MGRLDYYANSWLPARDLVISALAYRLYVDPSGKILLFEQYAPWKVRRCYTSTECTPEILTQINIRSTFLNLKLNYLLMMTQNQFMLSTGTTPAEHGAFKPFLSPLRALRAVKHYLKRGGAFETMNYRERQVSMAGYSSMRVGSLEASDRCSILT